MKVVLLHAFPLDESMWAPQLRALAGFDVATPRLYGRGAGVGEWAASVLDETDGELVAVGASMGGYVALAMARRAAERVRGLLLAGARAEADSPERRQVREGMIALLRAEGIDGYRSAVPFEMPPGLKPDELIGALELMRDRPDATDVVSSFGGPLTLVVGEHDELLGVDEARAIVARARDGRLEVVPDAGHIVSQDQPERFNEILLQLLSSLDGASS